MKSLTSARSTIISDKSGTITKPPAPVSAGAPKQTVPSFSMSFSVDIAADECVIVDAKYSLGRLTQIHFHKSKHIPREVFKIIAIAVPFHPSLSNITIKKGLDVFGIYEIAKILIASQITEICFECLNIKDAHYQLLLTEANNLSYLSLSRCNINDEIVENIMSQLKHPLPASKTLLALKLSCNLITDNGVRFIGEALRTNRCLQYLNLADNAITDEGADFLFASLIKFPLTNDEEHQTNKIYVDYCTRMVALMTQFLTDLNSRPCQRTESNRIREERRTGKKFKKAGEVASDTETIPADADSRVKLQKARAFAENIIGKYQHPYDNNNVVRNNGLRYSLGNNTICYLNLAYNNLTIHSIRKLLSILNYQRSLRRSPRGLISIVIEGNPLPANSSEVNNLDFILEDFLDNSQIIKKQKSQKPSKLKPSLQTMFTP